MVPAQADKQSTWSRPEYSSRDLENGRSYSAVVIELTNRAYPALIKIAREEGVGAWYRGFAPKVLRLGPGGGVLLLGEFTPFFGSAILIAQLSRLSRLCSGTISVPHMFRSSRESACISRQIHAILDICILLLPSF